MHAPGLRHEQRWQDVEELGAAGINVLSTRSVQHVGSDNHLVEKVGTPDPGHDPRRMLGVPRARR